MATEVEGAFSRPRSEHVIDSSVRADSRLLGAKGFRPAEAGNLTAYLHGLAPVASGWTPHEIERLLFLRHLVQHGHLDARSTDV
jgi:hypothetical protein